jgi:transcriptional regulator with PAS, ATPase and Fis domain
MDINNRYPRLAVIALENVLAEYLAEEIRTLLGDKLEVISLSPDSSAPNSLIDLVLLADELTPRQRERLVPTEVTSLMVRYTLSRRDWKTLSATSSVSRTVSFTGFTPMRNACDSLGLTQVDLLLDGDNPDYDVQTAMISLSTLMKISWMFGRTDCGFIDRALEYTHHIQCTAEDCEFLLLKEAELRERFDIVLDSLKCVAFHFDEEGYIISTDGRDIPILNNLSHDLLGLPITEAPSEFVHVMNLSSKNKENIISFHGNKLIAHLENFVTRHARGGIITLRYNTTSIISTQHTRKKRKNYNITDIIGESEAIVQVHSMIRRAAGTDLPILVSGETGTGKEIVASALHTESIRCDGPFLTVNCAALNESLVESELFGYEPGTFTGASRKGKRGLFRRADGGTLVLDEIESLSLHAQASLLRVVDNGVVVPVGGTDEVLVDVRVIAVTNQPLANMVSQGTFRLDLFHRLAVVVIDLPALRERTEDIPLLAQHFAERYGVKLQSSLIKALSQYSWPGNVRELQHCIEYTCLMSDGKQDKNSLPLTIQTFLDAESHYKTINLSKFMNKYSGELGGADFSDELEEILMKVSEFNRKGRAVGRRKLLNALRMENYFLSERRLREDLRELYAQGYVTRRTVRSGVLLTQRGYTRISS